MSNKPSICRQCPMHLTYQTGMIACELIHDLVQCCGGTQQKPSPKKLTQLWHTKGAKCPHPDGDRWENAESIFPVELPQAAPDDGKMDVLVEDLVFLEELLKRRTTAASFKSISFRRGKCCVRCKMYKTRFHCDAIGGDVLPDILNVKSHCKLEIW